MPSGHLAVLAGQMCMEVRHTTQGANQGGDFNAPPSDENKKTNPMKKEDQLPRWHNLVYALLCISDHFLQVSWPADKHTLQAIKAQNKHPTSPRNSLTCRFMAANSRKKIHPATAACPGRTSVPLPLKTTPVITQDPRNPFREAGVHASTEAMCSGSPVDPGCFGRSILQLKQG